MGASPSPSPEAEIAIGSVLDGRYRIDAILGAGGMGRVYRGEHTGIGRAVAIKVLHADLSRNREAAQRFQREALASGRLDHPNIVGVSDFGIVDDGPCYLVMEALEGESLGARLEREKRLPWREALEILRGVLLGLRHAHDRGVVHRDIKPDNVFLAKKDGATVVKILDFGIAKLYAGSPDDPASTRAGLTVGTPAYLSPEQAVGGEIKPASDLYSTTIVLFEMITGRPPFEDKDPLAMLGAHVSRPPPTIAEVVPGLSVPPELEDLIQRGLIKTSTDRINAAADYLSYVDGLLALGARASQTFNTENTPFPAPPPPPGPGIGFAPTASLTPVPATGYHASMQGSMGPPVSAHTSVLPSSTRPISLADAPPIPRSWIKVGVLVIVALAVMVALVAIVGGGGGTAATKQPGPAPTPTAPKAQPQATKPSPEPPAPTKTAPPPEPVKTIGDAIQDAVTPTEERRKELVTKLQTGKTCPDRKAAAIALGELGDPEAIPALKKARVRLAGGVLGIGRKNANYCLKAAAEAAIKKLGGTLK
ncbi:MAG: protein kinase [Kofleriaceae bacterium]|nr:protein kinase [Kofleriaceae bacterium]